MVPADSDRIPRVPPYSGGIPGQPSLPVRGCHPLRRPFPETSRSLTDSLGYSYNPDMAVTMTVWALSLSIATTQDIDVFFLLLRVLRCFSSPGSPHPRGWYTPFKRVGCPIRKCTDQFLFADPRALSQLTTSFLAS